MPAAMLLRFPSESIRCDDWTFELASLKSCRGTGTPRQRIVTQGGNGCVPFRPLFTPTGYRLAQLPNGPGGLCRSGLILLTNLIVSIASFGSKAIYRRSQRADSNRRPAVYEFHSHQLLSIFFTM